MPGTGYFSFSGRRHFGHRVVTIECRGSRGSVADHIWPYRVYAGDNDSFQLELPELYVKGRRISGSVPGLFLVNTNRRYDSTSEEYMLTHGVALATVDKWMRKINRITAGSRVLL